jgi:hypothetical protein
LSQPKQEDLERLMREFFPLRLIRKGCWSYHARTAFEGVDLYVYDKEQDIYHRAHVSVEELVAHNYAIGPTIGAALNGLVEAAKCARRALRQRVLRQPAYARAVQARLVPHSWCSLAGWAFPRPRFRKCSMCILAH